MPRRLCRRLLCWDAPLRTHRPIVHDAPVAHSDRALGFEPRGSRFDPCRAYLIRELVYHPGGNSQQAFMLRETLPPGEWWWQRKDRVQSLRRQGFSYREILRQIPFAVAKSTISDWCKHIELTSTQLDRLDQLYKESSYRNRLLGSKTTQRRRAEEIKTIRANACAEAAQRCHDPFWVAGVMLYWAEGSKTQAVGIANADPELIRFMMRWFRMTCEVPEEKFKAHLHIHTGQDENVMKVFWGDVTNLPLTQFGKSYIKREGTGHRKNILYQGTINIKICNRNLLHRIHGWIEGFCEMKVGVASSIGRAARS